MRRVDANAATPPPGSALSGRTRRSPSRLIRRYLATEGADAYLAQIERPGTRMARIAVRPTWVGVLDFQTRLPSPLGGIMG